ncbi:MAG: DegT/DnrJ/EryC1/StrS family aminotransferase [Oligoflexia bacterium]|nr:DegT/DnrJ/EryC1/StrS family aminotransferase [Oligoflexia bacterium]
MILKKFNTMYSLLRDANKYGFISGHKYLDNEDLSRIERIVYRSNSDAESDQHLVESYENKFSSFFECKNNIVSFASGRMAFYSLMRIMLISPGDEVILTGFTCAVMVNAVLRIGAKPVYCDIEKDTFGSCPLSIAKLINTKTKMVVAQHSFGIPCNIQEIADICKKRGVFLLEDCAITFDSKIDGRAVGNFGDAALFSTDHSKPINTIIGGCIYIKDDSLLRKMRDYRQEIPSIDQDRQINLFEQFLFENMINRECDTIVRSFQNVFTVFKRQLIITIKNKRRKIYLEGDNFNPTLFPQLHDSNYCNYPYPAKFPAFMAYIGLIELERWKTERENRKQILASYIKTMVNFRIDIKEVLPKSYFDDHLEIVPLRFVFSNRRFNIAYKSLINTFVDTEAFWFEKPIICCPHDITLMGYNAGDAPLAEEIGAHIINLPCNLNETVRVKNKIY